jgi:hypothetical protein
LVTFTHIYLNRVLTSDSRFLTCICMAHGTSVLLFSHLFSLVLFLGLIDINSHIDEEVNITAFINCNYLGVSKWVSKIIWWWEVRQQISCISASQVCVYGIYFYVHEWFIFSMQRLRWQDRVISLTYLTLLMNMIMMRRVVTGDEDAELYDLAVSFFSSQLSCIPLCRLFTSSWPLF